MMCMKHSLLCLSFFLSSILPARAGNQTLRFYDPRDKLVSYADHKVTAQATRFEVDKTGQITGIVLTLAGPPGSLLVHIYGHEGGMSAPILQSDLVKPLRVSKPHGGIERVTVTLPN